MKKKDLQLPVILLALALVFGLSIAQLRHGESEQAAAERFHTADVFLRQLYGGMASRYQQSQLDAEQDTPYKSYCAEYEALATSRLLSAMEHDLCPYSLTDAFVYETGAQVVIDALSLTRSGENGGVLYPLFYTVDFHLLLPDGTESDSYRAEGQLTVYQSGEETLVHDVTPSDQNLFPYLAQRIAEGNA